MLDQHLHKHGSLTTIELPTIITMMTPLQSSTNGKQRDEKNRESDHGILVEKIRKKEVQTMRGKGKRTSEKEQKKEDK